MKEVNDAIDRYINADEVVKLCQDLIRIPSHSQHPEREKEVGDFIARFLRENGMEVAVEPVEGERSNVTCVLRGTGGGRSLMLNGHLDTVPPYNMDIDPFAAEIRDGRIWGRGAVDMKGPIAAMLCAMLTLKRAGVELAGDLYFCGVIGEEERSEGTEHLVKTGFRTDGAIVGEPSNFEYAIGHRGLEWIEIEITGKAAHGGTPEKGVNAIVQAAKLIMRIQEKLVPKLRERFNPVMGPSVMNFGVIRGGTQPSTVADRCIVQLDRRYISSEPISQVLGEYQEILDELSAEDPTFKAEMRRMPENILTLDHLAMETSPDDPIAVSVVNVLRYLLGREPTITTRRGWTDASLLSNFANIPCVVMGPGDIAFSHTRNENIRIEDLILGVRAYALVAAEFCGVSRMGDEQIDKRS